MFELPNSKKKKRIQNYTQLWRRQYSYRNLNLCAKTKTNTKLHTALETPAFLQKLGLGRQNGTRVLEEITPRPGEQQDLSELLDKTERTLRYLETTPRPGEEQDPSDPADKTGQILRYWETTPRPGE